MEPPWNRSFWVFLRWLHPIDTIDDLIGHRWLIRAPPPSPSQKPWSRSENSNFVFMVVSPAISPHLSMLLKVTSLAYTPLRWKGLMMTNRSPFSPLWLWSVYKTKERDKKSWQKMPQHSTAQEIPRDLGAVTQKCDWRPDLTWQIYSGHPTDSLIYIYIFLIIFSLKIPISHWALHPKWAYQCCNHAYKSLSLSLSFLIRKWGY